jgi:hypothetical protein
MPIRWPNRIERAIALNFSFIALVAGALAIGIYLSLHFGKVQRDKRAR